MILDVVFLIYKVSARLSCAGNEKNALRLPQSVFLNDWGGGYSSYSAQLLLVSQTRTRSRRTQGRTG